MMSSCYGAYCFFVSYSKHYYLYSLESDADMHIMLLTEEIFISI